MLNALRTVTDGERVFPKVETQNMMRWWGPMRPRVVANLAEADYVSPFTTCVVLR